jgi:serine/threonine protein kinase
MSDRLVRFDPYRVLEVDPRARPEVIHAAYLALQKQFHPDKGGDTATAQMINKAWDVLKDPRKKLEFDEGGKKLEGNRIGNYQILDRLAEGGFGTTYRAEHVLSRMPVCVKHCHHVAPLYQQTLIDEARSIWDLRHYSLPVMRDFLQLDDGSLALVMSFIPGLTIEKLVEKKGRRLDPETVAWIMQRCLNALKYLHFNGVIHGDVKPQNVIVQPEIHTIVVVDFGLSIVNPTRHSEVKGHTPIFASPEQLDGDPLVPESDLYSLALTMMYALTGSFDDVRRLRVPNSVPDIFCDFIKRFLVRDLQERPNWESEDLEASLRQVRIQAFGRDHSNLKPV